MNKRISIVILNYKNYTDTIACLETVYEIDYDNYTVIVVDNDSQNDSLAHISGWLDANSRPYTLLIEQQSQKEAQVESKTVLIQSDSNRGYAAGNNIGIRRAVRDKADYVLILNNDTLVQKDFLSPLVEFLEAHPQAAMAGPKILGLDGKIEYACARKRPDVFDYFFRIGFGRSLFPKNRWLDPSRYLKGWDFNGPKQIDVIAGSCMLIRAAFLEQIEYLDENTFLMAEEYIIAEQARSLNYQVWVIPESQITHKHGKSIHKVPSITIIKAIIDSHSYYLNKIRKMPSVFIYIILLNWYILYLYRKFIKGRNSQ